jgi:hypothetical protein
VGEPSAGEASGQPVGDQPTGDQPIGDQPIGDQPIGDQADQATGDQPTGDQTIGDQAGERPTGRPAPRRWVVSAGVLAVVTGICGAGALALRDGGGDVGEAAVRHAAVAPSASPIPWTVNSLIPVGATSPSAAAAATSDDDVVAGTGAAGSDPAATGTADAGGSAAAVGPTPDSSVPAADRQAGVLTRSLVQAGNGRLRVVPGSVPAPSSAARSMRVRVEVEDGIGADGPAFADFVLSTLNDPRSWSDGGTLGFARTDGAADITVILASPDTSAELCAPTLTRGTMSCGGGERAVITMYRWMSGTPDYGSDLTLYRRFAINHEVGHVLGHHHAYCTPGHLAPVMMQQNAGLRGCLPNAWPFPRR